MLSGNVPLNAVVSSGNVPLNAVQGAIDYKYHVEKLNYHGFVSSFSSPLNFKGISLLQLKNDDPAHADKVKNTFIFNTFVFCQVFNEFNSFEFKVPLPLFGRGYDHCTLPAQCWTLLKYTVKLQRMVNLKDEELP
ncbi:Calcium-transporting ATPase 5, plasma membrane-type [Zea mays]|uniref:Calcium-transporting ATPase 5, plasma membrane-type n=1 Tax=Zea mays TaxID=4577 RepID=A0A3L6ECI3_MAIZE|nr:Calcium-transporting ATPase 5, plasma membrane-type [Zea mays]